MYSGAGFGRSLAHRASVASTSSFATEHRSQSPFPSNSGPSHPYGMYPQGTGVARSPSMATTSTARAPRQSFSGQGPTHPYGMYPQNVVEDDEEHMPTAPMHNQIPVGFPGLDRGYHRQIGPDGEEQDIIGPDGHMEQLPPYTRFPEEGPTKASLMAVPEEMGPAGVVATAGAVAPAASAATPPADSRDMLLTTSNAATPNDRLSSEQLQLPQAEQQPVPPQPSQPPPQPPQEQQPSAPDGPTAEQGAEQSEKAWKEKSWTEKRRTRILWGKVPIWVLIVLVIIIIILAAVLGAVVGALLPKADKHDRGGGHHNQPPPTSTIASTFSMFDASTIPIPTDLPSLPTGKFALPMKSPDVSSNTCLTESSQTDAWSCDAEVPSMEINIDGEDNEYGAYITPLENNTALNYGTQVPDISRQKLTLVKDLDDISDGPAWHFQAFYQKIVILRDDDFAAGQSSQSVKKRHAQAYTTVSTAPWTAPTDFIISPGNFRHRQVVAGDTPWYCVFNHTFIETFIYVKKNTTNSSSTSTSTTYEATPISSSSTRFAREGSTYHPAPTWTTTSKYPTATEVPKERRDSKEHDNSKERRSSSYTDVDNIGLYSRLVKVEERRVPNSEKPRCQKMQFLNNGELVTYVDEYGNHVIVTLEEEVPDSSTNDDDSSTRRSFRKFSRRDDPSKSCHCQWTFN
ncbi:uncharacterized protein K452DRAFT_239026 [Aplosporella prunicola CBS 121167]|uniref:DUF7820 domain-containing protein n=1 Tax=Aplosporella prunicola CBS 121167 TaxID=1176127 RepID=A0A6A6AXX2_9PEZI|nr:uncharacterized protein K452DRAFT_239026 [Aplosporella prunicola CBS 121167]KAF2135617.1 hypothetical protein K452DRAFT_239026 [Aplosporella prunicola CBS 121167]